MGERRIQRRSQGTDMYEYLRFPDAIAFELELRRCNTRAIPLGNRTVTNKCYTLLTKATFFPGSLSIGVRRVQEQLQTNLYLPCLVILAADINIDAQIGVIPSLCITKDIPYIYIPNKAFITDALNLHNVVYAVLITFKRDPGMRKEFEDAFEGIRSLCFNRKRKYRRASSTTPFPPGMKKQKPQMVSTSVSTVPPGAMISPLLYDEPGPSSSSDWVTISEDDYESTEDSTMNTAEEGSGGEFQEYIRVASPTPAPPPSEMMVLQNQFHLNLRGNEPSSTTFSSDDTPRAGPSNEYSIPPLIIPQKRTQMSPGELARKRKSWPIYRSYPNSSRTGSGEMPSDFTSAPSSSTGDVPESHYSDSQFSDSPYSDCS